MNKKFIILYSNDDSVTINIEARISSPDLFYLMGVTGAKTILSYNID